MTRNSIVRAAALTALLAGSAGGQQVRFAGSTLGCFYTGTIQAPSASPCLPTATASLPGGIGFASAVFDIFTDPAAMIGTSYGAIGNAVGTNTLGTVSAAGAFTATGNQYLRLRIAFSTRIHTADVNGTAGDNVFTVDYRISGSSRQFGVGGINFIPLGGLVGTGVVFDAANGIFRTGNFYTGGYANGDVFPVGPLGGTAAGTVNYHALDTRSITAGGTASLTSFLQIDSVVTTPEPASLALTATGLVVLVGAGLRRRRAAAA